MTTTVWRTHREATADEIASHSHDWHIIVTHSLLPGGDGHTLECECGLVCERMNPTGGPRTESFWWPL